MEEGSLGRVSRIWKAPRALDLALGPHVPRGQIHRALGSVCCSLLNVWSASRECLEMSYRTDYTWAFGRAAFN